MCIRDSCSYVEIDTTSGQHSVGTYLDYLYNDKHQCIEKVEYGERKGFDDLVVARRYCYTYNDQGPVSYTHLDVYKRQVLTYGRASQVATVTCSPFVGSY